MKEIRDGLARLDERQKAIIKKIDELDKKLFGNGTEGLTVTVQRHEDVLQNIKYGMALGFTIISIIILIANYLKI